MPLKANRRRFHDGGLPGDRSKAGLHLEVRGARYQELAGCLKVVAQSIEGVEVRIARESPTTTRFGIAANGISVRIAARQSRAACLSADLLRSWTLGVLEGRADPFEAGNLAQPTWRFLAVFAALLA